MRTTPSISQPESLVLRPHKMQFVIDELPSLAVCCAGGIYGGMEGVPYPVAGVAVFFFLSLVLLYRFIYLCRIHYHIGIEQLVCEQGVFVRKVDYMELYRIVDFQEHQSLMQQLCGLKTVRIFSTDRNTPRLDLTGMRRKNTTNEKREYMKSRTISIILAAVLAFLLPQLAQAQIAASNPLEWVALAEGNELINGQIDKQIKGQTQTAVLQNSIAAEFNRIHQWEKEYNNYLKTASGFASSLKACTHLYNDGVRIFLTLGKLGKAIKNNPQGIIASISMNNLYIETATELVSVFTLLNDAVAKGGTENMLVTAGMLDRDNGEVARLAMTRWRRAAALAH